MRARQMFAANKRAPVALSLPSTVPSAPAFGRTLALGDARRNIY
jgi:hypothetical protein